MKLYGLRYVKDEGSVWDDFYVFSHDIEKLTCLVKGVNTWFVGYSDVNGNAKEVRYTDKKIYPKYSIVELPFVV